MAGAFATAPSSASARPFLSTTTIGLPTAATASASCCCGSGTVISVRDCASPDMFWDSPIASTTMSARRAAATACAMPPAIGSSDREPSATISEDLSASGRSYAGCEVDRLGVIAIDAPWADQVVLAARERADERDRLARPRQRQQVAVILEQHDRFAARFARQRARCGEHGARRLSLLVDPPEGIVEQAEHRLDRKHPADRLIDHCFGHVAAANEVGQMLAVEPALHAHVDPGEEGEPRRVAPVPGKSVGDHLLVAGVVGDHEALETPFAAQQVGHQPAVAGRRDAVDLVEGRHGGERAGVEPGLVRLQIDFAQPRLRHVDRIVFEARLPPRHRPRNA